MVDDGNCNGVISLTVTCLITGRLDYCNTWQICYQLTAYVEQELVIHHKTMCWWPYNWQGQQSQAEVFKLALDDRYPSGKNEGFKKIQHNVSYISKAIFLNAKQWNWFDITKLNEQHGYGIIILTHVMEWNWTVTILGLAAKYSKRKQSLTTA